MSISSSLLLHLYIVAVISMVVTEECEYTILLIAFLLFVINSRLIATVNCYLENLFRFVSIMSTVSLYGIKFTFCKVSHCCIYFNLSSKY